MKLTEELEKEYRNLFDTCIVRDEIQLSLTNTLIKISINKDRYLNVSLKLKMPWYFIATIHSMESSLNFNCHLHNGDSLDRKTIHVPQGRPKIGNPPYSWEESALDALLLKKLDSWSNWTISGMLYKLEEYNGWGYRKYHPDVLSPYLWSGSNHYISGKYTIDGKFSKMAISKQIGGVLIIKAFYEGGIINNDDIKKIILLNS